MNASGATHVLRDRFETTDGSRAEATAFVDADARALPIAAFAVLSGGGDAFAGTQLAADATRAADAVRACFTIADHGTGTGARVVADITRMLTPNPRLADRVARMKHVACDVVPDGRTLSSFGFPARLNERAAGVFWDQPQWPHARIALREEHLARDPVLVVHEVAHALHRLAFSAGEQTLLDKVLAPVVGGGAYVDEMFAIYSEAEFLPSFSVSDLRAPGIYGWARAQWRDDHVFTRFVRKLYFPHKPLAGDKAARAAGWKKFSGS